MEDDILAQSTSILSPLEMKPVFVHCIYIYIYIYIVKAVLYSISSACLSQCGLAQYSLVCLLSLGLFHTNLSPLVSRLMCAGDLIKKNACNMVKYCMSVSKLLRTDKIRIKTKDFNSCKSNPAWHTTTSNTYECDLDKANCGQFLKVSN